jgi:hypothetical protein
MIIKSKNSIFFRAATFVILIKHLPAVLNLNLSRLKKRDRLKGFSLPSGLKKDRYFNRRKKRCLNKQRF